jgi:arabinogalactan oligomer/maltooligosaccharide transport system substrate-binding protein
MKSKLLGLGLVLATTFSLASCGAEAPLTIWVGTESAEFYTQAMAEYAAAYEQRTGNAFPHEIAVKGVDTGTAAATFLEDTQAGADIFTVAHDNLGRLTRGSSAIAPVTDAALLSQINNDNPSTFLNVIKSSVDGTEYTFGIPYVAQSLVLYYNKKYLNENDVKSWESIVAKAAANNKQALSLAGTDGFNNSFILLAKNAANKATTLKLYENGDIQQNFALGDDTVSKMKWGQWLFTHPNGAKRPTESGWTVELTNEVSIAFISGAWHFNGARSALGSNLGIAQLPTFTITADQAYGTTAAGTVFKSGTFADAKIFVMKKNSEKAEHLQDILKFLSSKEIQERSFVAAQNLPAYKNAGSEFASMQGDSLENQLARIQIEMFDHGIPQPFGFDNRYNFYYYSKGAPDLLLEIYENNETKYTSFDQIKAQLAIVQRIWITGERE